MSGATGDCTIMQFSTDALPERDRAAMLREFYGRLVVRLDIEPARDQPLHFKIAARIFPDLTVSNVTFSPLRVQRTRELMADGNDTCLFSALVSPGNTTLHRGNAVAPVEGSATLISSAEAFTCSTIGGIARGLSVAVPRKVLAASVPRLEDAFGLEFPDSEPLRLLRDYVRLLERDGLSTSPDLRRLIVTHVHDLMALALGASRDAAEVATGRGLRAARLHAIKADIRASLGAHNLTLRELAARHRVTPRYVQALFEDEGMTFSRFLIGERLERVYRMLRDPLQVARPVGAIAYDAGFGDLSHFNRAFRRRYGATPSDVRMAARRERGG